MNELDVDKSFLKKKYTVQYFGNSPEDLRPSFDHYACAYLWSGRVWDICFDSGPFAYDCASLDAWPGYWTSLVHASKQAPRQGGLLRNHGIVLDFRCRVLVHYCCHYLGFVHAVYFGRTSVLRHFFGVLFGNVRAEQFFGREP